MGSKLLWTCGLAVHLQMQLAAAACCSRMAPVCDATAGPSALRRSCGMAALGRSGMTHIAGWLPWSALPTHWWMPRYGQTLSRRMQQGFG